MQNYMISLQVIIPFYDNNGIIVIPTGEKMKGCYAEVKYLDVVRKLGENSHLLTKTLDAVELQQVVTDIWDIL